MYVAPKKQHFLIDFWSKVVLLILGFMKTGFFFSSGSIFTFFKNKNFIMNHPTIHSEGVTNWWSVAVAVAICIGDR